MDNPVLTIEVEGARARFTGAPFPITSGMSGASAKFTFDSSWAGLSKTAVFRAGTVTKDAVIIDAVAEIPAEVLAKEKRQLYIGVYGVSVVGETVIPTVWAPGPIIVPGTEPSGDIGTDETWKALREIIEQINAGVKNPQKLTFTGGAEAEYDGSEAGP